MYRTAELRAIGGWSTRTMAEDMDLTWTLYQRGHRVRFVPDAVCYPIEPHNFDFMGKQLRRWSHGFVQNVQLHWRSILDLGYLRSTRRGGALGRGLRVARLPRPAAAAAIAVDPLILARLRRRRSGRSSCPCSAGARRGETMRALASLPSFFVLSVVNGVFMLRAIWRELVVGRPLLVYEKGH